MEVSSQGVKLLVTGSVQAKEEWTYQGGYIRNFGRTFR